jgi:prepilin-type processing-associated H-X9-DG protein
LRLGKQRRPERRGGLTLVELIVLLGVAVVLSLILFPALNAARESARVQACSQKLTQLVAATQVYESHARHLPPGCENPTGPILSRPVGLHVSWIVHLLPYLGQNALYDRFDQSAGAYAPDNSAVRRTHLAILTCPSRSDVQTGRTQTQQIASSNYVGSHHDVEAPIDAENHGLLFLNSSIRYDEIPDGTSRTILIGEAIPYEGDLGWVSGTRATLRNGGSINAAYPPGTVVVARVSSEREEVSDEVPKSERVAPANAVGTLSDSAALFVGGFGSYHASGIVNIAFVDGAVRSLDADIDPMVLQQLTHRSDRPMAQRR